MLRLRYIAKGTERAANAIIPSTGEIVLLQLDGHLTPDEFEQALDLATSGCMDLYKIQRKALEDRYGGSA